MMKPSISLIAAVGRNGQIGLDNKLLWSLPEDLKNFRAITSAHTIVMGRKTFESIGKPLPKRTNVVISNKASTFASNESLVWLPSVEDTLTWLKNNSGLQGQEVFVIGGGQIYEAFLPFAQRLYLSEVDYSGPADAFFPKWDRQQWQELEHKKYPASVEQQTLAWSFHIWQRL